MGILIGGLTWFVGTFLSKLLFRALFALGLGFASYTGMEVLFGNLSMELRGSLAGLTDIALTMAATLKIDIAITILLSAYSVRMTLAAARLVLRK